MRSRAHSWLRPPYLAIPWLSARALLFATFAAGGCVTALHDLDGIARHPPRLGVTAALAEAGVQIVFAALSSRWRAPRAAALALIAWSALDGWFHRGMTAWVLVLLVGHVLQGVLLLVAREHARVASHEAQDRLVAGASALLCVYCAWTSVPEVEMPLPAWLPFIPLAVPAIAAVMACSRMVARRAWLARRLRRDSGDWAILPLDKVGSTVGLLPLSCVPSRTPSSVAAALVVARSRAPETYRSGAPWLPVALTTGAVPPSETLLSPRQVVAGTLLALTVSAGAARIVSSGFTWEPGWMRLHGAPRSELGQIAKRAAETYDPARGFCGSASRPIPADTGDVAGKRYHSVPSEWIVDRDANAGFARLGFSLDTPQYYQYAYTASPDRRSFEAVAHGDLNGDGVLSTISVRGRVGPGGEVLIDPNLRESQPDE